MKTHTLRNLFITLAAAMALLIGVFGALQLQAQEPGGKQPQADPTFTYQGHLMQGTSPYSGACDFQFSLYDAETGGTQIGSANSKTGVQVNNGYFNVELFFGNTAFSGSDRYLEISVNCGGGATTLNPRATLTRAPQALYADSAGSVDWSGVNNRPTLVESAGTGLSLSGVTISITPTYRLPQSCANNEIPKWNGSAWTCAADAGGTSYTAGTGMMLGGNVFSVAAAYRLPQSCNDNQLTYWDASASTWKCVTPDAAGWSLTGNSGTTTTNFIGTTDNVSVTFKTNNYTALRLVPSTDSHHVPNIIGGYARNVISGSIEGSVIGGGGPDVWGNGANRIEGDDADFAVIAGGGGNVISGNATYFKGSSYAVIGGGYNNVISGDFWNNGEIAVIGGGYKNLNHGQAAVIGGGSENSIINGGDGCSFCGGYSVIDGGEKNRIWGNENGMARYNSVGGGYGNVISKGHHAVIAGGYQNTIGGDEDWNIPLVGGSNAIGGGYGNLISSSNYSTIGGGKGNLISNTNYSTIPGGYSNTITSDYSFAAGQDAKAIHSNSFVWSDGSGVFSSTTSNQFAVQATGGVKLALGTAHINVNDHYTLPYTGGSNGDLLQLDSSGDANWVTPDMLQFDPQSSAPATCSSTTKGAMAYANTDNQFCFCNGTDWKQVYNYNTDCTW